MKRLAGCAVAILFVVCEAVYGQSNCVERTLEVPSTVTGEITIGSCKQGSEYHDIYHIYGLTAGRQLRFVLTRTSLTTLEFEMTRVEGLRIIDIINKSEISKSTMIIDVEIPVTQSPYNIFVSGALSYSTGGYTLSVMDLNAPNFGTQYVPIVGRVQGANNSAFRSDLKLYNPSLSPIGGSLVFTPRGQSASSADVSIRYDIPGQGVLFYEDIYAVAFPGGAGAARLAIVPDVPTAKPVVDSSTYTALPGGGELGQSPTVFTSATLYAATKLAAVIGKSSERSNVFVMTGPTETTIVWRYRDPQGRPAFSVSRTYAPNATYQFPVAEIIGAGTTAQPNGTIEASITGGSARVALSPVNNVSNQGRWVDFQLVP